MINITTEVVIKCNPQEVYEWLINLDYEKYVNWAAEHKDFKVLKKTSNYEGSIVQLKEDFGNFKINYKFKVQKISKNNLILLKALTFFPLFYLQIQLIKLNSQQTKIIHQIKVGFSKSKFFSKIFDRIIKNFFLKKERIKRYQRHIIEEYKKLEEILK